MKMSLESRQKIWRNAGLSLFIFFLPIALMFTTFYITGERPWEHKKATVNKPSTLKTNNENGSD